ncbi:MAG: ATP-binding cassette domain-containing protein [Candidatus Magasanikbacteria bacterium]|uniref:ABC transporter n=1 Tax=Candidatus Magasanikbacteria bacterium CG10_big_fil_rev_8_21_14_0_10_38_6 TaxID=1974647 RepID=A0A2M6NZE5_9BACT|nr:ATP-binding cassette domain-containing protein [Candidatus Magasanikbacteria bacterium]NCS72169.1 ATP-binding cassette domain-containing protein [Candidatus Magasanikbacteria bacterium]PIR76843.1 MAG: ABC transporter [Candidatus Magasanikbacteria bacterium CG10_big_fil_rev_8_21_14_0_10_38_6]
MEIIRVNNLSKTYEYYKKEPGLWNSLKSLVHREKLFTSAVKQVNFSIEEGEFVGFLGPNGAGKTTTLKMLSGILYPTSGEATVLGYTPWKRQAVFQKQFALVMGQKNQLWWDLPAMESFLLNKEIYEVPDEQFHKTLEELTTLLDIKGILDVQVRKLSLGERMKCELVAALLHSPKVLFLDEPTIGLDVISQNNIREFLKKYNKEKKTTIILTSHYMEDVEALCDRVVIINHGELMYDGKLQTLVDKYAVTKQLEVTFTEKVEKSVLSPLGKIKEYTAKRVILEVPKKDARWVAAKMLTTLPVDDILINEADVEEVIRRVFSEK